MLARSSVYLSEPGGLRSIEFWEAWDSMDMKEFEFEWLILITPEKDSCFCNHSVGISDALKVWMIFL